MASMQETAYPRLKAELSKKERSAIYTPTEDELTFARGKARALVARAGLLIHLKLAGSEVGES